MFDLTSSKLLILGIVALLVVGPKDLPLLLRTVGKYVGLLRRHANEFRAQFDAAMHEQELASLKEDMEAMKRDVVATVETAGRSVEADVSAATGDIENSIKAPAAIRTPAPVSTEPETAHRVNGTSAPASHAAAYPASGAAFKTGA